jgi:hypothetical protein
MSVNVSFSLFVGYSLWFQCLGYIPSNGGMNGELERMWKKPVVA